MKRNKKKQNINKKDKNKFKINKLNILIFHKALFKTHKILTKKIKRKSRIKENSKKKKKKKFKLNKLIYIFMQTHFICFFLYYIDLKNVKYVNFL